MFNEIFEKEHKVEPDPEPMFEQFPDQDYGLSGNRGVDPFYED